MFKNTNINIPPADVTLSMSESNLTKIMERKNRKTLKRLTRLIQKAVRQGLNYCEILRRDIGDIEFLKDYINRLGYSWEDRNIIIPDDPWSGHKEQCLRIIWGSYEDQKKELDPE